MVRTDPAGVILDANPAFVELVGYPLTELVGRPIARLDHPDHPTDARDARRVLDEGGRGVQLETCWLRKDGAARWIALSVQPVRDDHGRTRFHFGLALDITDRRQIEDELARVQREQAIILEHAGVGIVVTAGRTQIWANRWMEDTFGYRRDEIIGQSTRMYYESDAAFAALGEAAAALRATGAYQIEVALRRRDGTRLWIGYDGSPPRPGRAGMRHPVGAHRSHRRPGRPRRRCAGASSGSAPCSRATPR